MNKYVFLKGHLRQHSSAVFFHQGMTRDIALRLSITNDIVKAHGGRLDINTEAGNDSAFVISLPAV